MKALLVLVGALAGATAALLAPSAASAVVTIGPPMSSFDHSATCPTSSCAAVHQSLPSIVAGQPPLVVTAPFTGVVVRYRISGSGTFGGLFTGSYTDPVNDVFRRTQATPEVRDWNWTGSDPPWIQVVPGKPIAKGEYVGLILRQGAVLMQNAVIQGTDVDHWSPAPEIGVPTQAHAAVDAWSRDGFQAQVEPDADHDGLGDESQDSTPPGGTPTPPPGRPTPTPGPAPTRPGPGPGPAPGPAPGDQTKPTLDRFKVKNGRARVRVSEGAVVRLIASRRKPGHKRYGRLHTYTRTRSSAGTATFKLRRGSYRGHLVAIDGAGNASATRRITFRIR